MSDITSPSIPERDKLDNEGTNEADSANVKQDIEEECIAAGALMSNIEQNKNQESSVTADTQEAEKRTESLPSQVASDSYQSTTSQSKLELTNLSEKEKQPKVLSSQGSLVRRRQSLVGIQTNQTSAAGSPDKQASQIRPIKEIEADYNAYFDEVSKFRKAQAAQRSTQWLHDELSRIQTTKTEPLVTQLLNDLKGYSRVIESYKRGNKALKEEASLLKEKISNFDEIERPKMESKHNAELERLNGRIRELEDNLQEQWTNTASTTESYAKECESLKQAQLTLQKKYDEEMSKMKDKLDEYRERIDMESHKSTDLSSELTEIKQLLQSITSERDKLRNELESEQKNGDVLMKHLRDAETQLSSLRPWHGKFLSLEQYSKQTESILVERTSTLKRSNDALKISFKFMFIKFWSMFLRVRVAISSSRAKINALILAAEGEVEKLRAIERPGVIPNSDAAPISSFLDVSKHNASKAFVRFSPTFSSLKLIKDGNRNGLEVAKGKNVTQTIEEYGKSNAITNDDVTWHEALELAINRKRNALRKDLVGLKKVTCWELFQKLGDEISMVYDPVLELVTRARYLNEGCESLFAGNIVTMSQKLRLEEENERLKERVSQLEKQCEELALERDRERQTSATLNMRLVALGRESLTQRKTSKQVQIVEEVLKQQGKLCSLKELLRVTKRRIKQLREVKIQQHEQLESLTRKEARDSFTSHQFSSRPPSRMSVSKSTSALVPLHDLEDGMSVVDNGQYEGRSSFNRFVNGVSKGSFSSRSSLGFANVGSFMQQNSAGNLTQGPFQPIGVDSEDDEAVSNLLRQSLKETLAYTESGGIGSEHGDEACFENEFGDFKDENEVSEIEFGTPGSASPNFVKKPRLSRSEQEAARLKALERARERSLKEAETKAFWGGDSNISIKDILHDRYVAEKTKNMEKQENSSSNNNDFSMKSGRKLKLRESGASKPDVSSVGITSPNPNPNPPALLKPIRTSNNETKKNKSFFDKKFDRLSRIYKSASQGVLNSSPSTSSLGKRPTPSSVNSNAATPSSIPAEPLPDN